MSKIREVAPKVLDTLKMYPLARNNDKYLIRMVYLNYYKVNPWSPFIEVLGRDDLPSFEAIRRARQRIQAEREDLRARPEVDKIRMEEQKEYLEFNEEELPV